MKMLPYNFKMAMAYVEIILCTINLQIVPKETEMKMRLSKNNSSLNLLLLLQLLY